MGVNANNAITALQNLKAVVTTVEAGVRTGVVDIDAQTRALLTTGTEVFFSALFDLGSRAAQNATASSKASANNGVPGVQEGVYTQLDAFVKAIDAQIAVLQNPAQTPRRVQSTLL